MPSIDLSGIVGLAERDEDRPGAKHVPRSRRAALLAGLVVGFVDVGLGLRHGAPSPQLAAALDISQDPTLMMPAIILGGLLAGVQGAASSLYILRSVLNALNLAGSVDYALAGGAFGAAYALIVQAFGGGPPQHGWAIAVATGAATGFLFRIFAGAVKA